MFASTPWHDMLPQCGHQVDHFTSFGSRCNSRIHQVDHFTSFWLKVQQSYPSSRSFHDILAQGATVASIKSSAPLHPSSNCNSRIDDSAFASASLHPSSECNSRTDDSVYATAVAKRNCGTQPVGVALGGRAFANGQWQARLASLKPGCRKAVVFLDDSQWLIQIAVAFPVANPVAFPVANSTSFGVRSENRPLSVLNLIWLN